MVKKAATGSLKAKERDSLSQKAGGTIEENRNSTGPIAAPVMYSIGSAMLLSDLLCFDNEMSGVYLLRGVVKYARTRSGCRYKVYLAAETCHAKVRVGVDEDGIHYSGVADLAFQLVFEQKSEAENFESAITDIPRAYRKRPLSTLEIEEDENEEAVTDMSLNLEKIVQVNSVEELRRVLKQQYVTDVEVDGGTTSPTFDPLAGTATSYASSCVEIGEETLATSVGR